MCDIYFVFLALSYINWWINSIVSDLRWILNHPRNETTLHICLLSLPTLLTSDEKSLTLKQRRLLCNKSLGCGLTELRVCWESVALVNSAVHKTVEERLKRAAFLHSHKLKVVLRASLTWLWSSARPKAFVRVCVWFLWGYGCKPSFTASTHYEALKVAWNLFSLC